MSEGKYAKKSFGQHFLVNQGVVDKIVSLIPRDRRSDHPIVEIGPGPGALTEALIKQCSAPIVAIELDRDMVEKLKSRFAKEIASGRLQVIEADALKSPLNEILELDNFTLVGNLPYNVGTQITLRFIEEFANAEFFCLMLQKEVVERFISAHGNKKYGIPSIKLAWNCTVREHFWVKPGSFDPPPKVDSGVFSFARKKSTERIVDPFADIAQYKWASRFVSRAFGQRRKMLRGLFPELKLLPEGQRRAEELSPQELFTLAASCKAR